MGSIRSFVFEGVRQGPLEGFRVEAVGYFSSWQGLGCGD